MSSPSLESSPSFSNWFSQAPWRILATGVTLALVIAAILFYGLMDPTWADLAQLVITLAGICITSVGLGYILYRRGWTRSSSLMLTLTVAYLWSALVTLITVWIMQRQMFFSEHDLILSGVLLLFAAIIATTYGLFVAASVTEGIRRMTDAAGSLAAGDLSTRVPVNGRDEVARLSESFNEMAGHLQTTADRQRELEALRRNLIAWTSHDLRTPLTAIRVRIEALNDGLVGDPKHVARYYKAIRADVVALGTLIDDLFELAQLEAGSPALEMTEASLADLVSDCLESFQPLADAYQIVLVGEVDRAIDPVWMNPGKIGRVLGNLVENALRHSVSGGRVAIRAARAAEGVTLFVEDSGPGFENNELAHVFEQFYRGEAARSRDKGHAGLGLAIARGIVEAHGGLVWAENREQGGARVGITLPHG